MLHECDVHTKFQFHMTFTLRDNYYDSFIRIYTLKVKKSHFLTGTHLSYNNYNYDEQ